MIFLIGAVLLIGMDQGAEADFVAYFALQRFGMRSFATIVGTIAMASSLGLAIGGWSFAHLFDTRGDYFIACIIGGGAYIVAGLLMLMTGIIEKTKARVS